MRKNKGGPSSSPKFKAGDRVRLSEMGRSRSARVRGRVGTVIVVRTRYAVEVQFDENTWPTSIHASYIEADDPEVES
jgi:hypothetical protein